MYGKLFQGAFTGSLFGSGPTVFAVWAYVIANAYDSHIELNPRLLAACIGTDTQDIQRAIDFLCQPDPDSRNPDESGARLVRLDAGGFQYHVPSWQKYQDLRHAEDRREQNRAAAQKYRERQQPSSAVINRQQTSADVSIRQHESAESAHVDLDVDVDVEVLKDSAPDGAVCSPLNGKHPPACPVEEIIKLYHDTLPTNPRVRVRTAARSAHIAARWKQLFADGEAVDRADALAAFEAHFKHCAESKFLTGRATPQPGKRPFFADLGWLMNAENFARTIEGKYDK